MEQNEIVLASDDVIWREQFREKLEVDDLGVALMDSSISLYQSQINRDRLYVIETNDDVALLVRLVYRLHEVYNEAGHPGIVIFLSASTLKQNPSLSFWLIDGHAAVDAVWTKEMLNDINLLKWVRNLLLAIKLA